MKHLGSDGKRDFFVPEHYETRTFVCVEHGEFFYSGPDVPLCPGCIVPAMPDTSLLRRARGHPDHDA